MPIGLQIFWLQDLEFQVGLAPPLDKLEHLYCLSLLSYHYYEYILSCIAFRCGEESFQCNNNICVPISSYCNGIDDCGDESDEPKLCQTARTSSTTKSGSRNSKIFTGLITGVINSVLAGMNLDKFVTRVISKILEAPALDDFIDRIISKIMGWMLLLIIVIFVMVGIPFLLLLVCMLKPGCTIYTWRHTHLQRPPRPQRAQNANQPEAQHQDTNKDGEYAMYNICQLQFCNYIYCAQLSMIIIVILQNNVNIQPCCCSDYEE